MILILTAHFRSDITDKLEASAVEVLKKAQETYEIIRVPGAVELPIAAQKMIRKKKPDAIIALGCVLKGDTDHYEYVIDACRDGLVRVSLDESIPIVHGVLACQELRHAQERTQNGAEYAQTALHMKQLFSQGNMIPQKQLLLPSSKEILLLYLMNTEKKKAIFFSWQKR
ncbi:6,7-dimethyl-8-ribityllumazine synthase [Candidatus Gracilibacteria bacterium]|nr:6,7-dimethyl-8-ribityllumazine synthase [Candidatus Gracilibacteria bacterium]